MSTLAVLAASFIGPPGHGNDLTGWQAWPAMHRDAFQRGELADLHWSQLFASDAARFARMDLMCRLGLMAVEKLGAGLETMSLNQRERLGVCVQTRAGAIGTDVRFLRTPRPNLFSYSLTSTVLGEVCIRYRLQGPMLCLVANEPNGADVLAEASERIQDGEADACLCVGCEALDGETIEVLPFPDHKSPADWHAGALLLGKSNGQPREYLLNSGPLATVCRELIPDRTHSDTTTAQG